LLAAQADFIHHRCYSGEVESGFLPALAGFGPRRPDRVKKICVTVFAHVNKSNVRRLPER
jgi:hypothetical protein